MNFSVYFFLYLKTVLGLAFFFSLPEGDYLGGHQFLLSSFSFSWLIFFLPFFILFCVFDKGTGVFLCYKFFFFSHLFLFYFIYVPNLICHLTALSNRYSIISSAIFVSIFFFFLCYLILSPSYLQRMDLRDGGWGLGIKTSSYVVLHDAFLYLFLSSFWLVFTCTARDFLPPSSFS